MLKNYFKIAIRNLFRHSLFTFINIFGLALSMSICLLVLMRLKDRLGYDRFHPHPDRTYRIITQLTDKEGNDFRFASTPLPLSPTLTTDYTLTEAIVRLYAPGRQTATAAKRTLTLRTAFTEPSFFTVFGFTLQQGDPRTALQAPNSIILSRETAEKFFGRENVTGQTIQLEPWGDFLITGVLDEPRGRSHLDFDAYTSLSSLPALEKGGKLSPVLDQWNSTLPAYTYLQLKEGVTRAQLVRAIDQEAAKLMKTTKLVGKEHIAFEAQPLKKIDLGEELNNNMGDTGSRGKTLAELTIAFIILLMACFNYTNLSIARSLKRGKEIGIRKIAGAFRLQVFLQFIIESLLTALLSLGLAWLFLRLIMDYAPFASEMIPPGATIDTGLLGWFLLFSLFTGLLAGALPAWTLSAFKPVDVLKNLSHIRLFGAAGFRKALTIVQFTLSLFIIIFTVVASRQFNYLATADPGFRRDSILNIPLNGADYERSSNAIARLNGITRVSASSDLPEDFSPDRCRVKQGPGEEPIQMDFSDIDPTYIGTMGLTLLAGHTFPAPRTDKGERYVILNEKALRLLKLGAPAAAIGLPLWLDDTLQVSIAGVIKDFYAHGLDQSIAPLVFRSRPSRFSYLNVYTAVAPNKDLVAAIEKTWKANNPGHAFEYTWLKDQLYTRKSAWATVSMLGFLAITAITIACLGLLGMVMYTTETRRKEIGIRKVMGAGISAIILLLSKNFIKLVMIASAIALPLSYIAGQFFLTIFANRITIGIGILAGSFFALLLLVLLTIGLRIFQVAAANPVDSLRTE